MGRRIRRRSLSRTDYIRILTARDVYRYHINLTEVAISWLTPWDYVHSYTLNPTSQLKEWHHEIRDELPDHS